MGTIAARAAKLRFGERLESGLLARGERNISVRNAGWPGANIRAKHRRLASYPVEPDVVVLQYLTDDIHGYVLREGEEFSGFKRYADIPEPLHPIVDSSFLANWLYWSVPRTSVLDADFGRFEELYANPVVLEHHLEDVGKVIDWAEARDVELVAVIFPFLQDLEMSGPMTAPVESLFRSRGVPIVDVTTLVDDMPVDARLVSRFDPHPSAEVHRRVSEALAALPLFRTAD